MENICTVMIPQQFNYELYGVNNIFNKTKFLKKMCKDSVNTPIIHNDKVIGIIQKSIIDNIKNGTIISYGSLWGDKPEIFKKNDKFTYGGFSFR